ncbi:MAG: hypothetical protein C3F07_13350 [Anaerolineales bacterium]|nr:MAG: hypothetical protein C3F07_13350 [Anaerolineales bacterium]
MNRVIQGNLLKLAAAFLFLQAFVFTLSPIVRDRSWEAAPRWEHWIVIILWATFVLLAHQEISRRLPDADPYLFPIAALLSGWGALTIWRLNEEFGARQALWIGVSILVLIIGSRIRSLQFLRRYKYLLLAGGISITALTLILGTNPSGFGPRLWLGFRGIYFQPSEPLKLLLIAYLSAFLADKLPNNLRTVHLLYPTLILGGFVIVLLVAQRDLGTASIFIAIYTIMLYLATGRRRVLIISLLGLAVVGVAGYYFVDIIQARIDSWLTPWTDPHGSSFQIIQALIAIANGGIEGRGLGLGSPGNVPVAQSDFIYAAIGEETGLAGTLGLLALFGIILARGFRVTLRAPDLYRRFLAAGITTYFGVQTILIVGGNLRILPLTGVTLPFVSYGGSSLLTSFIAILILLFISNHQGDEEPASLQSGTPYLTLTAILLLGLFAAALANGWWSVIRGPDLVTRPDNRRLMIEELYVPRGAILDRSNAIITNTIGNVGSYTRNYLYPDLAPITGYIDSIYGLAGLEASLDGYLRGIDGNPTSTIVWNHLLYGTSPHGLDIRLSIDLNLQARADELMKDQTGAVVLLNASNGEVLAMSSHPTFDPNELQAIGEDLLTDPQKPLINRPAHGLYPTGSVMDPFIHTLFGDAQIGQDQLRDAYERFGFFLSPQLRMDVAEPFDANDIEDMHVTPLQMALASAALSNHGVIPAPRMASAVNTTSEGWVALPALVKSIQVQPGSAVDEAVMSYVEGGENIWSHAAQASDETTSVAWFIGGTLPNWQASPLVVVVTLENGSLRAAQRIGRELLLNAMMP